MLLTDTQIYALFFIVGCFSVKSLLDLQNWASRKNLWELWIVFIFVMVGHDAIIQSTPIIYIGVKWIFIAVLVLIFYLKEIDFIILDDKIALIAALSLLHPLMIPFLILIYTGLTLLLKRRIKHGFSHSKKIPTLPVLTAALVFSIFLFLLF